MKTIPMAIDMKELTERVEKSVRKVSCKKSFFFRLRTAYNRKLKHKNKGDI